VNVFRVFFLGGLTSYRALFLWKSPLPFVTSLILNPALQVAFFLLSAHGTDGNGSHEILLGGTLMTAALPGIFGGAMAVGNERAFGTLANVLIAPTPKALIFAGRCLPHIANGVICALIVFLVTAPVAGGFTAEALGRVALASLPGALACTALGLVVGTFGILLRDIWLLANIMMLSVLLLSGAIVPVASLPPVARAVAAVTPLTHAIEYARGGSAFALLQELGIAALLLLVSAAVLRYVEQASRSRATIEVV
jgi:ABC-2 type transport system permease protein